MSDDNVYQNFSLSESSLNLIPESIIDESPEFSTDIEFSNIQDKNCLIQCYLRFLMGNKLSSIFNISSSSISIPFILLPFVIYSSKILFCIIEIIMIGFFSFYSMILLLEQMTKSREQSYYRFIYNNIGKKCSYFYELLNFLFKFCILIIFETFSFLFLKEIILEIKLIIINNNDLTFKIFVLIGSIIIQFLFSINYYTIFITIKYLNSIFIIIAQFLVLIKLMMNLNNFDKIIWKGEFSYSLFFCIQILLIIFNNHNDIYYYFKPFFSKTFKKVNILINISWIIIVIEILLFMIINYLYIINFNIDNINIQNPFIKFINNSNKDIFYYIFLILGIIFTINIQIVISESLNKIKEEIKILFKQKIMMPSTNILISFFFIGITNFISISFNNLIIYIGICSGITCFTAYFFPAYTHYLFIEPKSIKKYLNLFILIIFPILGLILLIIPIHYHFFYKKEIFII